MKLLATDYDGTLKYGDSVMEEDLEAIRRWQSEGNLFCIVTGRSGASISKEMEDHGLNVDYLVCNNGALIFDKDWNRLYENYMETIAAIDLVYAMKEMDDVVSVVVNDGMKRHKIEVNPNLKDNRYGHLKPDMAEEDALNLPRYCQIVISMTDSEAAVKMAEQINHFFSAYLNAYANNTCVDVVASGVNKGEGLTFAAAYAGIEDPDVYAIGDGYNDLPMIEAYENGAAIAFAPADVQEAARNVYMSLSEMVDAIE